VLRIGLTGGIGSGKSTVAAMFADLGAVVIDADQISRDLVAPGSAALAELEQAFGSQILRPDGSLNRGRLAELAFSSPNATARLNGIMHPRIAQESARRITAVQGAQIVLYDMPLLVETGQREVVDRVIVVDVPEQEQVRRAVDLRGMDRTDVERRMQAQASRQERLAVADFVIDNSQGLDQTRQQVQAIWHALLASAPVTGADAQI